MICKKQGVFSLSLSNAVNVYSAKHGSCDKANMILSFTNTNNHLQYLQNIYYNGEELPEEIKKSSYCFDVN